MKKISTIFILGLIALTNLQAQVYTLGEYNTAGDVNSDGTVVAGSNLNENLMWDMDNGVTLIGGVPSQGYGGRPAINSDGTLISASAINPDSGLAEMSIYDINTQTWTNLGGIGASSGSSTSSAWGLSADGSTVVGLGWVSAAEAHAINWTEENGMIDMGSSVLERSTRANVANHDGSIIAGWQDDEIGQRQAAIWENGVQTLLDFDNGYPATEIGAMSNDGVWYGGGGNFDNGDQAWKYSEATGMVNIGPGPDPMWSGAVTGFSADGEISVGFYRPFGPFPAEGNGFIYTDTEGMTDLNEYAEALGIDTLGMVFALPLAISEDGSTVVGLGKSANGALEGFVLRLTEEPLGINESYFTDLSLYPNPVKNELNIKHSEIISAVKISTMTGQLVSNTTPNAMESTLPMSHLNSGVYLVTITVNNQEKTFKVVK